MICVALLCLCVAKPLASTGNENEVWFIGDQDPSVIQYDSRTRGLDYSLCRRVSKGGFIVEHRLSHRPVELVLHKDAIWFVDDASGATVYSMQRNGLSRSGTSSKISLQGFIETKTPPTGIVSLQDSVVVCCSGQSLQLFTFDGSAWEELPSLETEGAHVTTLNGELLVATPHEQGAKLWTLDANTWVGGAVVELQGTFVDLLVKGSWPLLVSEQGQRGHIVGLQKVAPLEIASFDVPKGRWSVVSSPQGLSVLAVERNGRTLVADLGWPSGRSQAPIELKQKAKETLSFIEQYSFLIAAILFSLFIFLRSRRVNPKQSEK